jgi:toxin-antitoxin system PIN domain toxin
VIAVDTNVLVYAHRRDAPWHVEARAVVRGLAEGAEPWAIAWPCVHEFLAIVTHPRVYQPPSQPERAIAQIEAWTESPTLTLIGEGPTHWAQLRELIRGARIAGPRVHDARVAAICLQHGVRELWTADRDFQAMRPLRTRNPLVGRDPPAR